jgi:hypothetical protein
MRYIPKEYELEVDGCPCWYGWKDRAWETPARHNSSQSIVIKI